MTTAVACCPACGRYLIDDGYRIAYLDAARSIVYKPARTAPRSPAAVIAQVDYDGKRLPTGMAPRPDGFVGLPRRSRSVQELTKSALICVYRRLMNCFRELSR